MIPSIPKLVTPKVGITLFSFLSKSTFPNKMIGRGDPSPYPVRSSDLSKLDWFLSGRIKEYLRECEGWSLIGEDQLDRQDVCIDLDRTCRFWFRHVCDVLIDSERALSIN